MFHIRALCISVLSGFLAACGTMPMNLVNLPPERLQSVSFPDLCAGYRLNQSENVRDELMRRGLSATDVRRVGNRQVAIGMSERAAVCAWGRPTTVNTTTTARGTRKQLVYRSNSQGARARYIYIENGRVAAIQN